MQYLEKFFAVTFNSHASSLYEATIWGNDTEIQRPGFPFLKKILLIGSSNMPVGGTINYGTMIGIHRRLTKFVPQGHGNSPEKDVRMISTKHCGGSTSQIVGLFLTQGIAEECLCAPDHNLCDKRWIQYTIATLHAIGIDHPFCSISVSDENSWLVPPEKWRAMISQQTTAERK